jgi:hypothetical protein
MKLWFLICAVSLILATGWVAPAFAFEGTPSATPSPTATMCPQATPELFWVEPVMSPTDLLTQTVTVRIGNGEAVTVTAESGTFVVTGTFGAYGAPALVPVDLLPGVTHHLEVQARVRTVYQWGCRYGGYTLYTSRDRYGQPLVIEQVNPAPTPRARYYLPVILRSWKM